MITKEQVLHVANLAKLNLTDEETEIFTGQLGHIIDYFQKLNEVDTSDISADFKVIKRENVFRADQMKESIQIDQTLKNAPDTEFNYFKVPKMKGAG